ncbi:MAG: Ig-like domain-containing protein [Taibaiella sp.]|nr:Ig-like domain-containing protein [Taibaiella sp.]
MNQKAIHLIIPAYIIFTVGCANQTMPTGGRTDTKPPKLLSVSPADSLKNTRLKKVELSFDEYITTSDVAREVQISPLLAIQPVTTSLNKKVTVKIADSLLEENTTYRISFGSSIKDLHEGNVFANYTFVFSTGNYFDSLQLGGRVLNAETGLPDSSGINVMLYYASESDSAVVRHKPKYIAKPSGDGTFMFKGLPKRNFKVFALKDDNTNLIYDKNGEKIAFTDQIFTPGDSQKNSLELRLFQEPDSNTTINADSLAASKAGGKGRLGRPVAATPDKEGFFYSVNADTTDQSRKSFDITQSLQLNFTRVPVLNTEKINISYDSSEITVRAAVSIVSDSVNPKNLRVTTSWKENTLYTLKLAKGFAKDSSGVDALPGKYSFRTFDEDDYGKITIQLPSKYNSQIFLLCVMAAGEVVYNKKVVSGTVQLSKLRPGKYTFRLIEDRNSNGKWDSGNLFLKLQPELVIPYSGDVNLKAGWENIVDFDKPTSKKLLERGDTR